MSETAYRTRRWTRKEYGRLIDLGVLHEDDPIELLEGRMIVSEPQKGPHATAIELAVDALRAAFGPGWRIRVQLPLGLDPDSEPEPDIAVIRGRPRDSVGTHPSRVDLVIEVADSSLHLDRHTKGRLYARAGIADYWIVNLLERVVEIYREPIGGRRPRYGSVRAARSGETMTPLAVPDAAIAVDDLLP